MQHYILKGTEPIPEPDVVKWGKWFQETSRIVSKDIITKNDNKIVEVSTVFLGLDHQFAQGPPPV